MVYIPILSNMFGPRPPFRNLPDIENSFPVMMTAPLYQDLNATTLVIEAKPKRNPQTNQFTGAYKIEGLHVKTDYGGYWKARAYRAWVMPRPYQPVGLMNKARKFLNRIRIMEIGIQETPGSRIDVWHIQYKVKRGEFTPINAELKPDAPVPEEIRTSANNLAYENEGRSTSWGDTQYYVTGRPLGPAILMGEQSVLHKKQVVAGTTFDEPVCTLPLIVIGDHTVTDLTTFINREIARIDAERTKLSANISVRKEYLYGEDGRSGLNEEARKLRVKIGGHIPLAKGENLYDLQRSLKAKEAELKTAEAGLKTLQRQERELSATQVEHQQVIDRVNAPEFRDTMEAWYDAIPCAPPVIHRTTYGTEREQVDPTYGPSVLKQCKHTLHQFTQLETKAVRTYLYLVNHAGAFGENIDRLEFTPSNELPEDTVSNGSSMLLQDLIRRRVIPRSIINSYEREEIDMWIARLKEYSKLRGAEWQNDVPRAAKVAIFTLVENQHNVRLNGVGALDRLEQAQIDTALDTLSTDDVMALEAIVLKSWRTLMEEARGQIRELNQFLQVVRDAAESNSYLKARLNDTDRDKWSNLCDFGRYPEMEAIINTFDETYRALLQIEGQFGRNYRLNNEIIDYKRNCGPKPLFYREPMGWDSSNPITPFDALVPPEKKQKKVKKD